MSLHTVPPAKGTSAVGAGVVLRGVDVAEMSLQFLDPPWAIEGDLTNTALCYC